MPRTKFQNVVFTAIMTFFMVFGMTVYSITVQTGELTYGTLIAAITEMWIEYVIVFLIVLLFMSKLAAKIAFRFMDPHTDKPMFITLAIQTCMVMLMVPIMTLIVNFIHNGFTADWLPRWLTQWALCLPMAFFWQILYAGPVVRLIFRTIFRKQLQTASAEH